MLESNLLMSRVVQCLTSLPSPEQIIAFRATEEENARIQLLASKHAGEGLTPQERTEYEAYILADDMMAMAKIQAQAKLRRVA